MSTISILSSTDDGRMAIIKFVDGKTYKLQHPGNRVYLEWQKEFFSVTEGVDLAKFLDKAFEYCVIPENHGFKPTVDTVKPKELGVWSRVLRRFLDGDIDAPVERYNKTTIAEGDKVSHSK